MNFLNFNSKFSQGIFFWYAGIPACETGMFTALLVFRRQGCLRTSLTYKAIYIFNLYPLTYNL